MFAIRHNYSDLINVYAAENIEASCQSRINKGNYDWNKRAPDSLVI